MLFELLKNTLLSIIFIVVVHSIYKYFKNNLTIPKTKDLVNKPSLQYKQMQYEISKTEQEQKNKIKEENEMKNELQSYLKELSKNKIDNEPLSSAPIAGSFTDNFSNTFKSI
tara:strand:+ start:315 stop:650 length:336 start_codon:yes stop_codon:yes gene_type:complete